MYCAAINLDAAINMERSLCSIATLSAYPACQGSNFTEEQFLESHLENVTGNTFTCVFVCVVFISYVYFQILPSFVLFHEKFNESYI